MKQGIFTIKSNRRIARDVYEADLSGDTSAITAPGQFVNIKLDGFFLRRPISVCDCSDDRLRLIYKTVGKGTELLSGLGSGSRLDILTGLGNGYDTAPSGDRPLLIGGGVGVPPLYLLCRRLMAEGKKPRVILGFNTAEDVFYNEEFASLGVETFVTTADGSVGTRGFVTDVMKGLEYTYFYTCGPMPMFRAIRSTASTEGQYSLEERMGCGFGACMGCSCKTVNGSRRVCKDGPVFRGEEIIWET